MADKPKAVRVEVFAVEDTALQLVWAALGPGEVQVRAGSAERTLVTDGGPGAVDLDGLEPESEGDVIVEGPGVPQGRLTVRYRTLPALEGPELYRFATVSDLHIGIKVFGLLGTMREKPEPDDLHPVRCTRAAFREAAAWGAQRIVAKGDITNKGFRHEWHQFGALVHEVGLPVDVIPGNHDVVRQRDIEVNDALTEIGLDPLIDGCRTVDVPGVRIVLVDSTQIDRKRGHLGHADAIIAEHVANAPGPVWMAMHHQPQRNPLPFYPPGHESGAATRFLDAVAEANPATFVTAGHTHRNRGWRHGPLAVTEVGSSKDYPGTWGGYVVHESGIRQVVRRITDPDCLAWIEYTRGAVFTAWGRWSPGRLSGRCFTHSWPP